MKSTEGGGGGDVGNLQRNQLSLDGAVERERRDRFGHLHLQLSERAFGDSGRLGELVVQVVQVKGKDTRACLLACLEQRERERDRVVCLSGFRLRKAATSVGEELDVRAYARLGQPIHGPLLQKTPLRIVRCHLVFGIHTHRDSSSNHSR